MGEDLRRLVLEEAQRLVQRAHRHAAELHGVELLEPVQCARRDRVAQRRDGGEGNQLAVGTGDVDVEELLGSQALDAEQLRDHLVAAPGHAEPVDEVASHRRAQVLAHRLEIQPHLRYLLAVDVDLRPSLVDLGVDLGRKGEHAALCRFGLEEVPQRCAEADCDR